MTGVQTCALPISAGHVVEYSLTPTKPDKQFKRAQELNAKHTMKVEADAVRVRNLQTREETICALGEIVRALPE